MLFLSDKGKEFLVEEVVGEIIKEVDKVWIDCI